MKYAASFRAKVTTKIKLLPRLCFIGQEAHGAAKSSPKVCTARKCNRENEIKMGKVKIQQGAIQVAFLKLLATSYSFHMPQREQTNR